MMMVMTGVVVTVAVVKSLMTVVIGFYDCSSEDSSSDDDDFQRERDFVKATQKSSRFKHCKCAPGVNQCQLKQKVMGSEAKPEKVEVVDSLWDFKSW